MDAGRRGWVVVGLITSIHFVQHIFRILPAMLPLLAIEFSYPLWQLGALVSVYFVGSGFAQAPMGMLSDRYDRRYVLPPSVALMAAGYLVFAAAPVAEGAPGTSVGGVTLAAPFLIMGFGAFVAGLGASGIHPVGYPIVTANVPATEHGRVFAFWGSGAKLGDAAAPAAVAVLILVVEWPTIFALFGIVGAAYAVGLFYVLSLEWIATRSVDSSANSEAADDARGNDHVARDTDRRRYVYPMLALLVFSVARAVSEKGVKAFLPIFIVGVYGYSFAFGGISLPPESFANVYFTVVFLIAAAVQFVTGHLVDRYDHRAVLVGFFLAAVVSLAVLATGELSPLALLAVLLALGATNWGWIPARDALVSEFAPLGREGRTFGYLYTISHLAGAAAPIIVGFVAERSGLRMSFLSMAVVMLLATAAIASLFSKRVYQPEPTYRDQRSAGSD